MDLSGEVGEGGAPGCIACARFGIRPAAPAVDPSGRSRDQADQLCRVHRWRTVRGCCILCGAREPWASPFGDPSIGCCRRCLVELHGINHARKIETEIEGREGAPEVERPPWEKN